ncbi:hypothetical protein AG1IA_07152 [Rhizoctonia solani AG-1 IA]|uniref:Chitin deacetylase n=1 Tax=Thanatephorus cucumeris (strain AG1-IA) TaxID=983506 RepID=L8WPY0_THACA|nr:hypothetical protein AG1IA_07152 [Rhizoctonia solani AG-1 IA]
MQLLAKLALLGSVASSLLGALAAPLNETLYPRQLAQVVSKCTVPNTVALTFDDGPYWYTYDISKAILAAGGKASPPTLGATRTWLHSPGIKYMMRCGALKSACSAQRSSSAIWDFDSGDSTGSSPAQSKQKYTDIANQRPSSILTLNHETYDSMSFPTLSLCSRAKATGSLLLPSASASNPTKLPNSPSLAPGPAKSLYRGFPALIGHYFSSGCYLSLFCCLLASYYIPEFTIFIEDWKSFASIPEVA